MENTVSEEAKPKRHGCLTTFLVFLIITNSAVAILYLFSTENVASNWPNASPDTFILLGLASLLNIGFAIALLNWKRWGFIGFAISAIIIFGINISIGVGLGQALLGLAGVAILYWTLQMGKDRKAWPHLE